jgi:hypothetical protein
MTTITISQIRKLQVFNILLFIAHAFSAIFIYMNRDKVQDFADIPVYRNVVEIDENNDNYGFKLVKAGTANIPILISVFFGITALFHLYYAIGANSYYKGFINQNYNPSRWFEYAITATIMIVILALTATVQDLPVLLAIIAMTVAIQLMGSIIEKSISSKSLWQAKMTTMVAWILQVVVFVIIGMAFIQTIKTVNDKLKKEQAKNVIPDWVYAILGTELFFYSLFGFVSLSMLLAAIKGNNINFYRYEWGYHSLSVVSKLFLGWVIYFGTTQGRDGEENQ